ncbi:MAG: hypothetical protein F9K23_14750 [Bacteroidetes bacterium]|nr:MAG: hypothetical protein F9K23_14750 [Bacteroidota bacterium]
MKRILLVFLLINALAKVGTAQTEELFTFGNNKAYLDEFTRQFYKNNPAESITRDTAKYYMGLFVNFKLKVQQAKDLGMDTASDFVAEMAQYKKQLAQPYMVDTSANDMLIQEAYSYMKQEVRASHIMVALNPEALPKDTIVAWNRALEFKAKLKSEPFDSVAKKYSEDESAKTNLGDLGYFTAFDMIYPFEKAAFNTKVGEVYGPFRTQFGYHIIKVWDKRPARHKIHLAHIMLRLSQEPKDDEILRLKQKLDSIASEINSGRSTFEAMANEYSEDINTRARGGELGYLSSTDRGFPEEFKSVAYSLKKDGDVSQSVKTQYGWHLLKRLGTEDLKPLDSLYNDIKRKISNPRDERYTLSRLAVIERIKKEYSFKEDKNVLTGFIARGDSAILRGKYEHVDLANGNTELFSIGNKKYILNDFSKFVAVNQQPLANADLKMTIENLYNSFVEQFVWQYEENNLDAKFDKYKYLVQEYHDGILLFNLSEKKVWNKGITDTTGLKEYYEANKTKYMWKDRIEASIYECKTEDVANKVKKWVKKKYADTTISRMAHEIDPLSLAIKTGKFQHGEHFVTELVKWKKGKYMVEKDGKYYFVVIKSVLKSQPKALSEVRGPITSEYQNMLEKQWIEELKQQYPVTINQANFDKFLNSITR